MLLPSLSRGDINSFVISFFPLIFWAVAYHQTIHYYSLRNPYAAYRALDAGKQRQTSNKNKLNQMEGNKQLMILGDHQKWQSRDWAYKRLILSTMWVPSKFTESRTLVKQFARLSRPVENPKDLKLPQNPSPSFKTVEMNAWQKRGRTQNPRNKHDANRTAQHILNVTLFRALFLGKRIKEITCSAFSHLSFHSQTSWDARQKAPTDLMYLHFDIKLNDDWDGQPWLG